MKILKFLFLFFLLNLIILNLNCEELSDEADNEPSTKLNDNEEKAKSPKLITASTKVSTVNPSSKNLNDLKNVDSKQNPKKSDKSIKNDLNAKKGKKKKKPINNNKDSSSFLKKSKNLYKKIYKNGKNNSKKIWNSYKKRKGKFNRN